MNLDGSVAIVTGGGTGIGRAVCEALARAGAAAIVVNYSRSSDEAEATAAMLHELGCKAEPVRANVADEGAVRQMVEGAVERYGRLDVLVNNAGTTHFVPFPDLDGLTDQVWDELLKVNLMGAFYCARAAAPALKQAGGAIVNVASISGHRAGGSSLAYGVTKAAMLQLTRGLAVALAPEVRVNAVSPGMVTTRWHRDRLGEQKADENARAEVEKAPLKRVAGPEEVAQAIMGLIQSDLVTGQTLIVDGGKHLLY